MTLIEFLLARIAEDAAVASEEVVRIDFGTDPYVPPFTGDPFSDAYTEYVNGLRRVHPEFFGPTDPRLLAECEAKRRIVTLWREAQATVYAGGPSDDWWAGWRAAIEPTLRAIALPYADHPDYELEWESGDYFRRSSAGAP